MPHWRPVSNKIAPKKPLTTIRKLRRQLRGTPWTAKSARSDAHSETFAGDQAGLWAALSG